MGLPVSEVRAAWCKFAVRSAKLQPGELGEKLRASLPAELRSEIRQAARMGWCHVRVFGDLCAFVFNTGQAAGARVFWHDSLYASIDQPLMRPLVRSGLFVLGKTPSALIKRTPLAWEVVTRGCGTMSASEGSAPDQVLYEVHDLPPELRSPGFMAVLEGGFMAHIHYLRCEGSVIADTSLLHQGSLRYVIRWRQREPVAD